MDSRPEPPPEGELIAAALKRAGLSTRAAAKRAGMSDNRWHQIVKGFQTVSAGVHAPVRGPAETVARMAQVVGVTPEQLAEAGRDDAAEALRTLSADKPLRPPTASEIADLREQLRQIQRRLDQIIGPDEQRDAG